MEIGKFMKYYYCKYCGAEFKSILAQTASSCSRNPEKGVKHVLYEGPKRYNMFANTAVQKQVQFHRLHLLIVKDIQINGGMNPHYYIYKLKIFLRKVLTT